MRWHQNLGGLQLVKKKKKWWEMMFTFSKPVMGVWNLIAFCLWAAPRVGGALWYPLDHMAKDRMPLGTSCFMICPHLEGTFSKLWGPNSLPFPPYSCLPLLFSVLWKLLFPLVALKRELLPCFALKGTVFCTAAKLVLKPLCSCGLNVANNPEWI